MIVVYRSSTFVYPRNMFDHIDGKDWIEICRTRDWSEAEAEVSSLHDRGFRAAIAEGSGCLIEYRAPIVEAY
jgi:hypothetical protein